MKDGIFESETRWLEYLKVEGKTNKVVAENLTHFFLGDMTFEDLQENLIQERDVMTYVTYKKKLKIESLDL